MRHPEGIGFLSLLTLDDALNQNLDLSWYMTNDEIESLAVACAKERASC